MIQKKIQNALRSTVGEFDDLDAFLADKRPFVPLTPRENAFLAAFEPSTLPLEISLPSIDFRANCTEIPSFLPESSVTACSGLYIGTRTGRILSWGGEFVQELFYMRRVCSIACGIAVPQGGLAVFIDPGSKEPKVLFDGVECILELNSCIAMAHTGGVMFLHRKTFNRQFEIALNEAIICMVATEALLLVASEHCFFEIEGLQVARERNCAYSIYCGVIFNGEPVFGTACSVYRYMSDSHVFCFTNAVIALVSTEEYLVACQPRKVVILDESFSIVRIIELKFPCRAFSIHNGLLACAGREITYYGFRAKDDSL